ncbi:MAG: family 78 glycoside hydrolase catalytic domain [Lentisphaerota bacterium]
MNKHIAAIAPINLRTEYLVDPVGIDIRSPRFSWQLNGNGHNDHQAAYQIEVASNDAIIWDSEKVASFDSIHIEYQGPALEPRTRYSWRVRYWNRDIVSQWSEPASFETGLGNSHWNARWIESDLAGDARTSVAVPCFRKDLDIRKNIAGARLYITALGTYEVSINGRRVGDGYFTPGWTEYRKRIEYQVYDVVEYLSSGKNTVGVMLADGWYCGTVGGSGRQRFGGDRPKLSAELAVDYAGGESETVITDASWRWNAGPIKYSDHYHGEYYDARDEMPGWDLPEYDDSSWAAARLFPAPDIIIDYSHAAPVRRQMLITPVGSHSPRDGVWIFDLGQNITGWVRVKVRGVRGTHITLRHAEVLAPDGTLYTRNLVDADATDHYILKDDAVTEWEPRFTFHGFRYVEVSGYPGIPGLDTVTGVVIHSDLERVGNFSCSEPIVNQLSETVAWGLRDNLLEVPSDCPSRGERLAWTGDAQVMMQMAVNYFNVAPLMTKWIIALNDSQGPNGEYPYCAPNDTDVLSPEAGWGDAGIICPWFLYLHYGDRQILERFYPNMQRWLLWLWSHSDNGLRPSTGWGDWLAVEETPKELFATAYFGHVTTIMCRIAKTLGHAGDAEEYASMFTAIRSSFNSNFINDDERLRYPTQAAAVLSLAFELVEGNRRKNVLRALVENIHACGAHPSTGFMATPFLLPVLSENGHHDLACLLCTQTSYPSWFYMLRHGATTIWERWNAIGEDGIINPALCNSFNHAALGALGIWFFNHVGGIKPDPELPGYKHIIFQPYPGGFSSARTALDTPYGRAISEWYISEGIFHLTVSVPPNSSGTIYLPESVIGDAVKAEGMTPNTCDGRTVIEISSGRYNLCAPLRSPDTENPALSHVSVRPCEKKEAIPFV